MEEEDVGKLLLKLHPTRVNSGPSGCSTVDVFGYQDLERASHEVFSFFFPVNKFYNWNIKSNLAEVFNSVL